MNTPIRCDTRVGNERNGIRLNSEYKCLLQHNDINYPCKMKNISITGALVCALEVIPYHLEVGDTCELLLSSDRTWSSRKYASKVTRLEHPNIALCFTDLGF